MSARKEAIQRFFMKTRKGAAVLIDTALVFGGIALVSYGAWTIYDPAGFIVCGSALFWIGLPDK